MTETVLFMTSMTPEARRDVFRRVQYELTLADMQGQLKRFTKAEVGDLLQKVAAIKPRTSSVVYLS